MALNYRTVCARARGSQGYSMGGRLGVVRVVLGAFQQFSHSSGVCGAVLYLKAGVQGRCLAL